MCRLARNEFLVISENSLWSFFLSFIFIVFLLSVMYLEQNLSLEYLINKMYLHNNIFSFVIRIFYLLLTLVIVVKISGKNERPVRWFKN